MFVLTIFIGLRYEVGGDWIQYEIVYLATLEDFDFFNIDSKNDYLYILLSYFSSFIIQNIYFLNFILALFFLISLNYFIEKDSDYFLVLTAAIPIHILVVGMGFIRQSIAISFFLVAIKYLTNNKNTKAFFSIIIGIGFHKTLLPFIIVLFFTNRNKFLILITIIALVILSYFYYDSFIRLFYFYSGEGLRLVSNGALYRVIIAIFFSVIFIIFSNLLINNSFEKIIYLNFSYMCILSFPFVFVYSTMIDRLCFYFIPIQLFVLMRLKKLFKNNNNYLIIKLFILIFYSTIYFTWLNFAHHKISWLPYKNLLLYL